MSARIRLWVVDWLSQHHPHIPAGVLADLVAEYCAWLRPWLRVPHELRKRLDDLVRELDERLCGPELPHDDIRAAALDYAHEAMIRLHNRVYDLRSLVETSGFFHPEEAYQSVGAALFHVGCLDWYEEDPAGARLDLVIEWFVRAVLVPPARLVPPPSGGTAA
jgi:hypothetical protein